MNRLAKEKSLYLQQHSQNPVDWYPWGEEAFHAAKTQGKPIFLSIGYSACHWCHVMEEECFNNVAIASRMNELFINIKVDREERPDLDLIYQPVAQAITGGGGWPLSVFLTAELKPFFGGTYFPPQDRFGRPGFLKVLEGLAQAYQEDSLGVAENTQKLLDLIQKVHKIPSVEGPDNIRELKTILLNSALQLFGYADTENGGFGNAPKFPSTTALTFLWRVGCFDPNQKAFKEFVIHTLDRMSQGGIYDALGGGFHRYSVDAQWRTPHFEKMLSDQALLIRLYSEVLLDESGSVYPEQRKRWIRVLLETKEYLVQEMKGSNSLYFVSQDADSEGEEGRFYLWTEADRVSLLQAGLSEGEWSEFWHAYEAFQNSSILPDWLIGLEEPNSVHGQLRDKIKNYRKNRIHPAKDSKTLLSLNALMVSAWVWMCLALNAVSEASKEFKSLESVSKECFNLAHECWTGCMQLMEEMKQEKRKFFLEDYAYLSHAALDLTRIEKDNLKIKFYAQQANEWVEYCSQAYGTANDKSGFYLTESDTQELICRPLAIEDRALPSAAGVLLQVMQVLEAYGFSFHNEMNRNQALLAVAASNPFAYTELLNAFHLQLWGVALVQGKGCKRFLGIPFLEI